MAGPVPLLFLGDSITVGWLDPGLHSPDRAALSRSGMPGMPRVAENFGIGGDHIEHLLWRTLSMANWVRTSRR